MLRLAVFGWQSLQVIAYIGLMNRGIRRWGKSSEVARLLRVWVGICLISWAHIRS